MACPNPSRNVRPLVASILAACSFLHLAPTAAAVSGTWTNFGIVTENWSTAAGWSSNPVLPGTTAGDVISFNGNWTNNATITLDTTPRIVGVLSAGDTGSTFRIFTLAASGGATLTFDNAGSNAQLNGSSGNVLNTAAVNITAPVLLNSNLDIANSSTAGSVLSVTGGLTAGTAGLKTITNAGPGSAGVTLGGVVGDGAGSIAVVQNSATSTLTLSGAHTFTGGTTVSAGRVVFGTGSTFSGGAVTAGSVGTGAVTLADGVTIAGPSSGSIGASQWNLNGDVNVGFSGQTNRLSLSGIFELGGTAASNGSSGTVRTLKLFNSQLASAITGGTSGANQLSLEVPTNGPAVTVRNGTLRLAADPAVAAGSFTVAQIGAMSFTGATGLTIGDKVLTVVTVGTAFTAGGATNPRLTIESGGVFNSASTSSARNLTIFSLSGAGAFTNLSNNVSPGNTTLTIDGSDTAEFSGVIANGATYASTFTGIAGITGTVSIAKSGTGTQIFSGTNTYTGGTTLSAGTLIATTNATALGSGPLTLSGAGTTLRLANDTGLTFGNNTTVSAGMTIRPDRLTAGAGVTHTLGTLSIGAQTLSVSAGANVTSGAAGLTFGTTTLTGGATFDVGAGALLTLGAIGGSQNFIKQGGGQLVLNTASTRSGTGNTTTLSAGTLRLGAANALNTVASTLSLGGGVLSLGVDTGSTFTGANVSVTGPATIQLDRATSGPGVTNTLGTLSIGAQTLSFTKGPNVTDNGAALTFGNTTLTTPGPAVLDIASGLNVTLGAVSGAFNLTKQGAGQLNLLTAASRSTSAGSTTLSGGTLRLGALAALNTASTGPLALNGGTLALAVDAGGTVTGTVMTVGGNSTIQVDRATPGTAPAYTLNTLSFGAFTLGVTPGANLTADTAYGVTVGATTLTGNATVDVANNGTGTGTLTINGKLTGAFDFRKQGAGRVVLATSLTSGDRPSGSVTLQAGTLVAQQPSALGEVGVALNLNGGTLDLASSGANALATTVGGDATILSNSTNATFRTHTLGPLSIGSSALTVSPGAAVSAGTGTAALVFGAVTLTGSPTFNVTGIGTAAASLSVGAISDTAARTVTVRGNGNFAQTGVFDGNLAVALDSTYTGITTLNQVNTFTGGVTATGGTLSITPNSTATGATITAGPTGTGDVTLGGGVSVSNTTTSGAWLIPTLKVDSPVNLTGSNRLSVTFKTLELTSGTKVLNVNGKSLAVTGGNTLASESTGLSQWEMANTTALGLPTVQNGNLSLQTTAFSGTNYGAMRINNAMAFTNADLTVGPNVLLIAGTANALGSSAATSPNLTLQGLVSMAGTSKTVKSLAGTGAIFGSMVTTNAASTTLNLVGTTGTTDFSGVIGNGPGTGALGLTKTGGSTQVLSGANTYTGPTAVNGGTLEISGSISSSSAVSVTGGTLLLSTTGNAIGNSAAVTLTGGTLAFADGNAGGAEELLGSLILAETGTGVIDFGSGTTAGNAFSFSLLSAASVAALNSGTATLNLWNWSPGAGGTIDSATSVGSIGDAQDRLLFGIATGLNPAGLGRINFYAGDGVGFLGTASEIGFDSRYELVPIPEPSSTALIGGAALLGLAGLRETRRRRFRAGVAQGAR